MKQPDMVLRGRHSEAIDRAIAAAKANDLLDDVDDALLTVLRAGGWALDSFESQNKPYGPSKVIDPLVNALREAHLTPDSRAESTDESIKELLHDLGTATVSDSAIHDPTHAG
ncbi:hypothetical protein [Corynebacterium senegalense]|uniref:hypothetical protein n=1 Tax=Corynebacterium senegalense TaxID=2080750 RepID=UPI0011C069B7|nr:hypothetical protein [Corynebacterium senegalense]